MQIGEIIARARKALAEGEAILEQTRAVLGISARYRIGPFERKWRRGDYSEPADEAAWPGTYYLTADDLESIAGIRTMIRLAKLTKKPGLQRTAYRDAGLRLWRLQEGRSKAELTDLVRHECSLTIRRAYELIAIGKGERTLDEIRADATARQKRSRSKIKGMTQNIP